MKQSYHIIRLEKVDSTSTYLREHPELWDMPFCTVTAREQTGGRGRSNRAWHMAPGLDLAFSTVFRPTGPAADLACLTLYAGLAVHRALRGRCDNRLRLKWPNDICHDDRKLGGILCEALLAGTDAAVIIGIGINVNSTVFPADIRATATSLRLATGREHGIEQLREEILDRLIPLLQSYRVPMDGLLLEEWTGSSASVGKEVTFINGGREERGVIAGINPDGSVRIDGPAGVMIDRYRGDVFFDQMPSVSRRKPGH